MGELALCTGVGFCALFIGVLVLIGLSALYDRYARVTITKIAKAVRLELFLTLIMSVYTLVAMLVLLYCIGDFIVHWAE